MKRSLIIGTICSFFITSSAFASTLCVVSKIPVGNDGKVPMANRFKVASGSSCPKNYSRVTDSSKFKGDKGNTGDRGIQGIPGNPGISGVAGASSFEIIPTGTTIKGVGGLMSISNESSFTTYASTSFNALLPNKLLSEDIIIARAEALDNYANCGSPNYVCLSDYEKAKNASGCTGTFQNPTAPSGKVCIYFNPNGFYATYKNLIEGRVSTDNANFIFRPSFGILLTGSNLAQGNYTWAYTAP